VNPVTSPPSAGRPLAAEDFDDDLDIPEFLR
jgi:hypothetical protein